MAKKPTTMRTAAQSSGDRMRKGPVAKAGKTKSILDVLQGAGLGKRPATTIRAGGGGRKARLRGGATSNRANSQSSSLSR